MSRGSIKTGTEPTVTETEPIEENTSTATVTEPFSVREKNASDTKTTGGAPVGEGQETRKGSS